MGKERDPESWNGDIQEDPDEIWDTELLNSDEASSLVKEGLLTHNGNGFSIPYLRGPTLHCLRNL